MELELLGDKVSLSDLESWAGQSDEDVVRRAWNGEQASFMQARNTHAREILGAVEPAIKAAILAVSKARQLKFNFVRKELKPA